MSSSVDPALVELIKNTELLDGDDAPVTEKEPIGMISNDRLAVWKSRLGSDIIMDGDATYVAVKAKDGYGQNQELAVKISNGACTNLLTECKVSYEKMPPSHLVEYMFDDSACTSSESKQWQLSMVSLDYLLAFRAGKFKDWEKRFLEPSCKAEFRRMYQIGPVYKVYDHPMFPSQEDEMEASFTVTDEKTGRKLILPRPVSALRIWNSEKQAYDEVDAHLDGSPKGDEERAEYWKGLVAKLKETYGEEEFNDMTGGQKS